MFRVKTLFVFLFALVLGASLWGGGKRSVVQAKPRLAILPFTGPVPEDAETIAEFFSFEEEINRVFTPVPRTRAVENLMKEQQFQRSGLTDSDTIAELGKQLNADYVLAGHIATLGTKKMLLITIVNVGELQQIAGDYREYLRIEETVDMLPDMAMRIGEAARRDTARKGLPRLAVLPFNVLSSGMNQGDAELLAQILATELANSGKYAVFPRTKAIEKVMEEHHIERSGMTDPESIRVIGEAVNAQYVLSANVRKLGTDNYFSASILHIVEASQGQGSREKYRDVSEGITIMPKMALALTGGAAPEAEAAPAPVTPAPRPASAPRAAPAPVTPPPAARPQERPVPDSFVRINGGTFTMGSPASEAERDVGLGGGVPEFVNDAYINASEDVLIGIGTYKIGADASRVSIGITFAQTRARMDIVRQLQSIIKNMITDYTATSGLNPDASLSFQESVTQALAKADLKGARVVKQQTDSNGLLWVVMEYGKSAAANDYSAATFAAKLAVPAAATFDAIARMENAFDKAAGGGPIPVSD
ncbi:MAG: hypothetical protein LBE74_06485 [Treponema sp.]|jgi:TolB-like protein|nr:hypothetical protein [Treponema sp.]